MADTLKSSNILKQGQEPNYHSHQNESQKNSSNYNYESADKFNDESATFLDINDEKFIRGKVPMTKQEIRILTLAKARIKSHSIVADVGAGTGSITIEAALLAPRGKIFAIEKNSDAVELIKFNVDKFSVDNVEIICAEAPTSLEKLPELDAAIIGGSGGRLEKILDILYAKLKIGGRIVLNAITIQTTATCLEYFRARGWNYEASQVQITRLKKIGSYDMNQSLNPIWIITTEKS